jgi:OmpA-like transmembrane domain
MTNFFRQHFLGFTARTLLVAGFMAGLSSHVNAGGMDPQSDPRFINTYVGVGYGFKANGGCKGADVCERGGDILKIFGGYRFTPSLATEISYYYLGKTDSTWGSTNASRPLVPFVNSGNQIQSVGVSNIKETTHMLAFGVALESEMFPNVFHGRMVQHLRSGLGVVSVSKVTDVDSTTVSLASGLPDKQKTEKVSVAPYLGAGLSFGLTPRMRVFTSADVLAIPNRLTYSLTFGAGGEF